MMLLKRRKQNIYSNESIRLDSLHNAIIVERISFKKNIFFSIFISRDFVPNLFNKKKKNKKKKFPILLFIF